jgi:foldase protein PrsA
MEEEKLNVKEKNCNLLPKKGIIISGLIGLILGVVLVYVLFLLGVLGFGNKTIATMKSGKVTENSLYEEMKKYYPISYVLEKVDEQILNKKYELTNEQEEEINSQVETILTQYSNYGYTESEFLEENGFETKEDFINYMKLDYRRNLWCIDYFKTLISEEEIKDYYENNDIYGKISTKHILVQTSDDVSDEDALKTANEIIAKLDSGTSFDDVAEEYSSSVVTEEVDFDSFSESSLEEAYAEASKSLEKDSYTKEPVKTSYGYHVIYCVNKEEKPTFEQAENDIVEELGEDLESEDQYIRYKALIKLREDNNLKFRDDKFKEDYEEYCDQVNSLSNSSSYSLESSTEEEND